MPNPPSWYLRSVFEQRDGSSSNIDYTGADADTEAASTPTATCLYQSDFDRGTMMITQSGNYQLCEDITFAPYKPNLSTATDEEIAHSFDPVAVGGDMYDMNELVWVIMPPLLLWQMMSL